MSERRCRSRAERTACGGGARSGRIALWEFVVYYAGERGAAHFYDISNFSWVPKIETVLLDDKNAAPQGRGEPAIVIMGAVIANAMYDVTGARLIRRQTVKRAPAMQCPEYRLKRAIPTRFATEGIPEWHE